MIRLDCVSCGQTRSAVILAFLYFMSPLLFSSLRQAARPALRDMTLPALKGVTADADSQDGDREATGKGRGAKADAASRRAWVPAIEAILEAGWRRCGVFGKVVNSGTVRPRPSLHHVFSES